jgi:HSP20 family protein
MDELLGWVRSAERGRGLWFPMDVLETEDDYLITAEVSRVARDSVDVSLDRRVLTIKITKPAPQAPENGSYHIRERDFGEFSRSVSLPSDIDPSRVSASYNDGVLEVRVGKAEESKPRRIDISTL